MGAFEFNNVKNCNEEAVQGVSQAVADAVDTRRVKDECIIALKVYDSCRQVRCKLQHCHRKPYCSRKAVNEK